MLEIDGSHGEGGGQLLRTACALAALTGEETAIRDVRARRHPPGLAPQHLTAVRAVAALCDARVEGAELRSTSLAFRPGPLRGGDLRFDVTTAGSVILVLQAMLPVALASGSEAVIELTGGTDVRAAPPLDYLRFVILPLLSGMGAAVAVEDVRRGYYPRGGGMVRVDVRPGALDPLRLDTQGPIGEIHGIAHVANLPAHIAERMADTARRSLQDLAPVEVQCRVLGRREAIGQGGSIVLWTSGQGHMLGASGVARRGVPAEQIAAAAADALRADIISGATLDVHAVDQMLIHAALVRGRSSFLARRLSSHARTVLWLLRQFLPVSVMCTPFGECTRVEIGIDQDVQQLSAGRPQAWDRPDRPVRPPLPRRG